MESLYNGRATIDDSLNFIEITIPTRKIWFFIFIFSIWLIPMVFGGLFALVASVFSSGIPFFVPIFALAVWGAAVTFVGRMVFWMVFGKEVIQIDEKILHIRQKGLLFSKPKTYDMTECRNFRTVDNVITNTFPFAMRAIIFNTGAAGTIAFDYGMKTIKFADAIDEAEGKYILKLLKEKHILTSRNFEV